MYLHAGVEYIGCWLHLILFIQNLLIYSHFPFGVLQFKLFIFAVWILDWIRVQAQFNLNQRRKLESRGGNIFDTAIKKHSFGYGSHPMAAQVYRKYNLLT